jgi:hypothetical protein
MAGSERILALVLPDFEFRPTALTKRGSLLPAD